MIPIEEQKLPVETNKLALFALGFRPFFLLASVFSVISMLLWFFILQTNLNLKISSISVIQWHAHEMVFGYSMAVIAGFLLTAVKNWTGVQTIQGRSLFILSLFWFLARVFFSFNWLLVSLIFDTLFSIFFLYSVIRPVFVVKQWMQLAILSKLLLIVIFHWIFYLGVYGYLETGTHLGIYGAFYLIIGLLLTMGRRVLPFFIEQGVNEQVELENSKILDLSSLFLFLIFFIVEVFVANNLIAIAVSLSLFMINSVRLLRWHSKGIWTNPMLWSLYLGFWFINLAFLLYALTKWFNLSPYLMLHLFAVGGVGLITLSMSSRVSLGHTGRNVNQPHFLLKYVFLFMLLATISRVFLPMIWADSIKSMIFISQVSWILAFVIYSVVYLPIFIRPRVDGKPG
ncbi:MAG: NnrS family protein [Gammaproteobacteria bacterium]|nr:NnrS family protein [Gammaproteobacteria bacterium]